ncbi:MAG: adenylate/guanylate cyclase domain-containing protein [bacterium]
MFQKKNSKHEGEREPPKEGSPGFERPSEKKPLQGLRLGMRKMWRSSIEIFKFLPIRFKLSLIIGAIVVIVMSVFSLFVLRNQKIALMNRMNQVCNVLIQNLAESVKEGLLLDKKEKVPEHVLRLKKTSIEGLKQVAILNRKAEIVAFFNNDGEKVLIDRPENLLKIRELTILEKPDTFEYYYPITTKLRENNTEKVILLGVAFISFSKSSILAPVERARDIAVGTAIVITLFSIIVINLIARKMANQIQLLSHGAKEVGKGNLHVEISVNTKDELGLLATEFNKMTQHLREKMQMQKFMSKLTVDMIRDTVGTNGKSAAIERKMAVLFSDVRNFSTVAEELEPEEIVKLINIYFDLQTKIIENYHGIVDKFMGDQIMAIFEGRNMADNVLRAAVEIQRQVRLLNQERTASKKVTLEMGIGINNGTAVMGHMGSAHRMDYTVIGDVVNVAARLCTHARARQIVTSLQLAREVNGSYPTTRLKSISVKGRTQTIDVCEIDYGREILI